MIINVLTFTMTSTFKKLIKFIPHFYLMFLQVSRPFETLAARGARERLLGRVNDGVLIKMLPNLEHLQTNFTPKSDRIFGIFNSSVRPTISFS